MRHSREAPRTWLGVRVGMRVRVTVRVRLPLLSREAPRTSEQDAPREEDEGPVAAGPGRAPSEASG